MLDSKYPMRGCGGQQVWLSVLQRSLQTARNPLLYGHRRCESKMYDSRMPRAKRSCHRRRRSVWSLHRKSARTARLQERSPILPESFEWTLLRSELIPSSDIPKILEDPSSSISKVANYLSWERFFTDVLVKYSADTRYAYKKARLNEQYLKPQQ